MFQSIHKASAYQRIKIAIFFIFVIYSISITVILLKLDLKPLVIGIDSYGTRIIGNENDPILKLEKQNFLKTFITYSYNYDETNYDERTSYIGDLMSQELWDKKKNEFLSISTRLKEEPLSQKGKILDLREIDETHYEADLDLKIQSRLKVLDQKLRVNIEIKKSTRTATKPFPWEVIVSEEKTNF